MSEALAVARGHTDRREQEVAAHAAQLQEILGLARDITGTLSVRAVAESSAMAARTLAGAASCRLWPSPEALVAAADRTLYAAKRNGRNQVAVVESAVAGAEL